MQKLPENPLSDGWNTQETCMEPLVRALRLMVLLETLLYQSSRLKKILCRIPEPTQRGDTRQVMNAVCQPFHAEREGGECGRLNDHLVALPSFLPKSNDDVVRQRGRNIS